MDPCTHCHSNSEAHQLNYYHYGTTRTACMCSLCRIAVSICQAYFIRCGGRGNKYITWIRATISRWQILNSGGNNLHLITNLCNRRVEDSSMSSSVHTYKRVFWLRMNRFIFVIISAAFEQETVSRSDCVALFHYRISVE